jgi:hypothetical protein
MATLSTVLSRYGISSRISASIEPHRNGERMQAGITVVVLHSSHYPDPKTHLGTWALGKNSYCAGGSVAHVPRAVSGLRDRPSKGHIPGVFEGGTLTPHVVDEPEKVHSSGPQ